MTGLGPVVKKSDAERTGGVTWLERLEVMLPGKGLKVIRRFLYPPHVRAWHRLRCRVSGWDGHGEAVERLVMEASGCRDMGELRVVLGRWRSRMRGRSWMVPSDRRGFLALEACGMGPER